jgi:hypothetical protein
MSFLVALHLTYVLAATAPVSLLATAVGVRWACRNDEPAFGIAAASFFLATFAQIAVVAWWYAP